LRDAIELEWRGIPSVAIITDALIGAAEAIKSISGTPDYEYAVTAFPVSQLDAAGLKSRARELVRQIERLLTSPS
jgi:hypothetical protein